MKQRRRFVNPEFFQNEFLAELPFGHRLALAGLWTCADREGRLEDRPKKLKALLFPYDDVDFEQILAALAQPNSAGPGEAFLVRYSRKGKRLIQVNRFSRWQTFHRNEAPSELPAPKPVTDTPLFDSNDESLQGSCNEATTSLQRRSNKVKVKVKVKVDGKEEIERFVRRYSEICKSLVGVREINADRAGRVARTLRDLHRHGISVDDYLTTCENAPWLNGSGGRWRANFDFVIGPRNFLKIIEGYYDKKQTGQRKATHTESGETSL